MWHRIKNFFTRINSRAIYLYSCVIGMASGLVALLFHKTIHTLDLYFHQHLTQTPLLLPGAAPIKVGMELPAPNWWFFFLLPIAGGLITGMIAHFFGKEARGGGTELFLEAFHHKGGQLRKRAGLIKFFSTIATLTTGGSGGKEGPMTLIGASLGSLLARWTKMGARARRTLLLVGAAGGLGAIFRSPLGGAVTAVEVLYKEDFESDSLIPCIISSVTAYTIFGTFAGFGHVLNFKVQAFSSPITLVFYAALALVCTLAGYVFVRFYTVLGTHFFTKIPLPKLLLPALGGLMLACVGFFIPEVMGGGLGVIQQALYGSYAGPWLGSSLFFLLLAVLKILTTGFTVQSGGSAGLLVPSFFIGAMLGGFCGTLFHRFFPEQVPSITPFMVVGMAAFFAAVTNASLGALIIVTELTGGYELLPPLMLVAVVSLIFSHKWSIYENQVANKFFSKAHLWDMNPVILKDISIAEAVDGFHTEAIIDGKEHLSHVRRLARELHETEFLVTDTERGVIGILSLHDLDSVDEEDLGDLSDLLVAKDMMHPCPHTITPRDTLLKAMQFMTDTDFGKVPVVDDQQSKATLLGYIIRRDILKFYNQLGQKKC